MFLIIITKPLNSRLIRTNKDHNKDLGFSLAKDFQANRTSEKFTRDSLQVGIVQ